MVTRRSPQGNRDDGSGTGVTTGVRVGTGEAVDQDEVAAGAGRPPASGGTARSPAAAGGETGG
jgi:hypothetical protein